MRAAIERLYYWEGLFRSWDAYEQGPLMSICCKCLHAQRHFTLPRHISIRHKVISKDKQSYLGKGAGQDGKSRLLYTSRHGWDRYIYMLHSRIDTTFHCTNAKSVPSSLKKLHLHIPSSNLDQVPTQEASSSVLMLRL